MYYDSNRKVINCIRPPVEQNAFYVIQFIQMKTRKTESENKKKSTSHFSIACLRMVTQNKNELNSTRNIA